MPTRVEGDIRGYDFLRETASPQTQDAVCRILIMNYGELTDSLTGGGARAVFEAQAEALTSELDED